MKRVVILLLAMAFALQACAPKQEKAMSITVNLRYTGTNGSARAFAEEMISSGTVALKLLKAKAVLSASNGL